jgi:hypothetical protein
MRRSRNARIVSLEKLLTTCMGDICHAARLAPLAAGCCEVNLLPAMWLPITRGAPQHRTLPLHRRVQGYRI